MRKDFEYILCYNGLDINTYVFQGKNVVDEYVIKHMCFSDEYDIDNYHMYTAMCDLVMS